jgi:hypothetical protein
MGLWSNALGKLLGRIRERDDFLELSRFAAIREETARQDRVRMTIARPLDQDHLSFLPEAGYTWRLTVIQPGDRMLLALDDTPTQRYGPLVEGAGVHHNPTPGPPTREPKPGLFVSS